MVPLVALLLMIHVVHIAGLGYFLAKVILSIIIVYNYLCAQCGW